MQLIQFISMDFSAHGIPPRIYGKQDDSLSRAVKISLYNGGAAWPIPDGVTMMLRYRTPSGAIGLYDTMPDGTSAFSADGNAVTIQLVDQIFAQAGVTECELRIIDSSSGVSTWTFLAEVEKSASGDASIPSDYINVLTNLAAQVAADAERAEAAADSVDISQNQLVYPIQITRTGEEGAYVYEANHTLAQIQMAYGIGRLCVCYPMFDDYTPMLLTDISNDSATFARVYAPGDIIKQRAISIQSDGTVSYSEIYGAKEIKSEALTVSPSGLTYDSGNYTVHRIGSLDFVNTDSLQFISQDGTSLNSLVVNLTEEALSTACFVLGSVSVFKRKIDAAGKTVVPISAAWINSTSPVSLWVFLGSTHILDPGETVSLEFSAISLRA